ncbi:hypothetical protein [Paenibacillus taihuensis]|nr:hypothetical protein [Paenibacillus taihuensis]
MNKIVFGAAAICMMLLSACGDEEPPPAQQAAVFSAEQNQSASFQQEVVPVLEELVAKYYKEDEAKFNAQTDLYFDEHDPMNPLLVFLVHKEESKGFRAFRKEIHQRLGHRVVFKQAPN